jgi:MFS family permease
LLVATSPFAVYYDTEARMYSLVILLSTLGVLAYIAILRRPTIWNVVALAVVTCGLLYSHYWALFFVAATAIGTAWAARSGPHARSCRFALAALAAGTCAFGPWVPTFLFQLHHTGTPWATPADFTALVYTFTQFAGGNSDAGRALALVFAFLALLGIAGTALDRRRIVLDLRTRPGVRGLALLTAGTLLIAVIAGKLTGSTFADRYSAVILLPCLLVVAYGVTALSDRRVQGGVVAVAVAFGLAASIPNAFLTRTQAGQVASAVLAGAHSGDVVAVCPDQLGPAVSRALNDRFDEVAFPRANSPEIVNWVDYATTVRRASTRRFVKLLESRAGPSHAIWYVWAPGYLSYGNDCQAIANELSANRSQKTVLAEQASDTPFEIFEGESLDRYAS